VLYPLVLGGVSIIASIIGCFFVKASARHEERHARAVQGPGVAGVLSLIAFYFVTTWMFPGQRMGGSGTQMALFGCLRRRPGADRRDGLDHRVLHRHAVQRRCSTSRRPPPPATAPTSSPASACR
jgi:hypothetical protein